MYANQDCLSMLLSASVHSQAFTDADIMIPKYKSAHPNNAWESQWISLVEATEFHLHLCICRRRLQPKQTSEHPCMPRPLSCAGMRQEACLGNEVEL